MFWKHGAWAILFGAGFVLAFGFRAMTDAKHDLARKLLAGLGAVHGFLFFLQILAISIALRPDVE